MPSRLQSRIERLRRLERDRAGQDQPIHCVLIGSAEHPDEIRDVVFMLCDPRDKANDHEMVDGLVRHIQRKAREGDDASHAWEALVKILGVNAAAARVALPAPQPGIEGAL